MNNLVLAALSIFPLLGLLLLGWGLRNVWRAVASVKWPQAAGVVLSSDLSTNTSKDSQTRTSSTTYSAVITVAYKANGQDYKTTTVRFGQTYGSGDPSEAEIARLRFPQGANVPVAYNPDNPALAVIKPGFTAAALTVPAIGLALTLVGIMFMIAYLTSTTSEEGVSMMVVRLFASIFMLIGVILMTPGVRNLMRAGQSLAWPKAPGVVLYSGMTSSTSVDKDDDGHTTTSTTYNSPLVIEYEVNSSKHYSNKRRFGQLAGSSEEWAKGISERYPAGAKIQVTYSPSDPDLAVLEPGISNEAYRLPGAGAAFFLFGLAVFLFMKF